MGMYDTFETSTELEKDGIWIDYGDFAVKVAHAGGSNEEYAKYAEKKLKPIRKALDAGAVDRKRSQAIMREIYAETIIMDWTVLKEDGTHVRGIESRDGGVVDFNKENVIETLRDLPKLQEDLIEMATSMSNFRQEELNEESKNSPTS